MQNSALVRWVFILMLLVLMVLILVYAKPFLVPLTFAAILAMLLLPVTRWLERKGIQKVLATLGAVLVLVAVIACIVVFISWQVSDLAKDAPKIEQQLSQKINQVRTYITQSLGIPPQKQQQMIQQQQSAAPGKLSGMITDFLTGIGSFLTDFLLVLVYIFLFIHFRRHLKQFVLKLVPKAEEANTNDIINSSQQVAQKYLTGLGMMILCLWVMYGIGFSIVGVKNAAFFAMLCGLLEMIPFVGNLTGTAITMLMPLAQGGSINMLIGIAITYGVVQFVQSYLLEPLVVGREVNINPTFTIIGIVAGEALWGIPGMVLAIPLLGITKIVFDHIPSLKPYGFLIGESKKKEGSQMIEKIKNWFK